MRDLTVSVFTAGEAGGNPCTLVQDGRSSENMIALARARGHECCLARRDGPHAYALRFFAPSGEMDMCAHASAGAAWVLCDADGAMNDFHCQGGVIRGFKSGVGDVSISQPVGKTLPCEPEAALVALGLGRNELAQDQPIINAASTRVKTLVPVASVARLQSLDPDPEDVRVACEVLGSTGLYPWVALDPRQIEARQFPKAAGYSEDPATGVAAAALFFALGAPATGVTIHQGRAMQRLSRIIVSRDPLTDGCLLTGRVRATTPDENLRMAE